MIEDKQHVLFILNEQRYAVEAADVDEIVQLPELAIVPDAPRHLEGVFDLRGRIIQVFNLSVWFNQPSARHRLTDSVIVFTGDGHPFGIVVHDVLDVVSVSFASTALSYVNHQTSAAIIGAAVRIQGEIVFLLDRNKLIRYAESAQQLLYEASSPPGAPYSDKPAAAGERSFFRDVPPEEQRIFRKRARSLMREDDESRAGCALLAVVGLNGEYFGFPLECVHEFAAVNDITPVPCCPEHIVGNVNLRGEILTVVDIRPSLKMSVSQTKLGKIVVVGHDGVTAGISVDEIYDAAPVDPAWITRPSTAADSIESQYLIGVAPYGDHMLTILDLPRLLTGVDLVVNDEV